MGAAASAEEFDPEKVKAQVFEKLKKVKKEKPDNLCAKHLTEEYINSLTPEQQQILYKCTLTGLENPDSHLGCYAMKSDDYDTFGEFFDKVIREYHGDESGEKVHTTDWNLAEMLKAKAEAAPEGTEATQKSPRSAREEKTAESIGSLDLTAFGLDEISMRVRVGRNLKSFNLPGMMCKQERMKFEKTMLQAFDKLISMENYGGKVYSLTPDFNDLEDVSDEEKVNPNKISDEEYQELVKKHIMFKNMDEDPYLKSAGISSDWPYGRGCYVSKDESLIIWYEEEDQLRIMCMKKGKDLAEVFSYLKCGLDTVESIEGIEFARSDKYGFVTSCPSNLGTGMRASVHLQLPKSIKQGEGKGAELEAKCKELGLSVRGVGGEHTAYGEDGTVDISPKGRLFVSEAEIIKNLYDGIKTLVEYEKSLPDVSEAAA
eukprot:snap_masked-scaffold_25-processed-gene-2.46-mRNA-1 protein AED:0.02 eAED:0.02 QI:0/0/0/1/1/1/2/0/429